MFFEDINPPPKRVMIDLTVPHIPCRIRYHITTGFIILFNHQTQKQAAFSLLLIFYESLTHPLLQVESVCCGNKM